MVEESQLTIFFAWFCLLSHPVILAIGSTLNRALRKLDENTVNIYSNFTQIFFFLTITLALGQKVSFFVEFSWLEWIVMVGCGFFQVLSSIFNFKATQNLPLPVRMPLNVTGVLYQIVIDIILFHVSFNTIQIVMILGVVAVKICELSYFYCVEIPR